MNKLVAKALASLGDEALPCEEAIVEAVDILAEINSNDKNFSDEFRKVHQAIIEPFAKFHLEELDAPIANQSTNPYRQREPRTPFREFGQDWRSHITMLIRKLGDLS
jgi:hypothetical protein